MHDRDFEKALRDADAANEGRTLSTDAERRIRARMDAKWEQRARSRWALRVPVLVTVTALAALIVLVTWPDGGIDRPIARAGFSVPAAEADAVKAEADGTVRVLQSTSRLEVPGARVMVSARPGAHLLATGNGIRVLEGQVLVSVDKRKSDEPEAVVEVSHGFIEVLGTRFTVMQRADGGEVTLHEGRIRFRTQHGRTAVLSPGESLTWPLATTPGETAAAADEAADAETTAEAVAPASTPTPESVPQVAQAPQRNTAPNQRPTAVKKKGPAADESPDVEALIADITAMRRRGQFSAAANRLEQALEGGLPASTAERLSFELGSILTWQLKDARRGCEVWRSHRAKHRGGRYAAEISRAEATLGCSTQ